MTRPIRVLVIDDSALVRQALSKGLSLDPLIQVVGTAGDPYAARDQIMKLDPDVLTLDIEMPHMNGVEFLRKLMPQYPLPVVMVSALTERGKQITLDALDAGAVDFVTKPKATSPGGLSEMLSELAAKLKIAATVDVKHWRQRPNPAGAPRKERSRIASYSDRCLIAIGASTGGTEALRVVLTGLPADCPGILVVQHMPPGFTKMFAERLNSMCAMEVKEAETGDSVQPGRILIAPGDRHMTVRARSGNYEVVCESGPAVCGHCPSVEVLFDSVARHVGARALGVMLTGMGCDGADAMLAMRQAGAATLAQDENTCAVFGMPKEAFKRGGAASLIPLEQIAATVLTLLNRGATRACEVGGTSCR